MNDLQPILSKISEADSSELSEITRSIISRYHALFPDDEVFFLSLPTRNRAERAAILRQTADMIEREV